ncbi:MAG: bifunctional oligoribonuclease/PAP phosphatase NrnA [Clostridia bacterium]|nr:bifunctional oligoribonuclease/PAP phosphatase NrnA [Clostridia bacterium]
MEWSEIEMHRVIEKIKQSKSVAIFPHINEDPDALCSCFAFAEVLKKQGKEAVCYISEEIEKHLAFLGGEYVIYNGKSEYIHDLALCLDCGDFERLGERKKLFYEIGNSVNIDHHYTNTNFADVNYVDGAAAATGEILFEMFRKMGVEFNERIARYLYIAISSDTGCFKYSNVTPKTMRAAADLLEYKFDHAEISRLLFDTYSLNVLKLRAEVTRNIHSYADGKINVAAVKDALFSQYELDAKEATNIVDIPRCVAGTEIAVCLKNQNGTVRVSMRSNGNADVSKIAMKFGGGGHTKAAGCGIEAKTLEEAEKIVVEECLKVL